MNVKIDIHNNHVLEKKLEAVSDWKVPDTTKKEVKIFVEKAKIGQVNEGKRLSDRTISKYLTLLKYSLESLNKQTNKITKKDIEDFDNKLAKENKKSVTDYRTILKVFLRWKIGQIKTQNIAGWLDTRTKKKTPDYLSESEVSKLYKSCKNIYERFLIAILFDSGARIEEFLNIRLEDVHLPEKNESFAKITLKEEYSKTMGRTISLYWTHSLEALSEFLEERKREGIRSNEQLYNKTYDGIRMFLSRLGKKVLKKQISPHLFRHSSATYYATKLNRQQLCYRYGWKFSSDMPDVYISRAGMESKELDDKIEQTKIGTLETQIKELKQMVNIMYEQGMKTNLEIIKKTNTKDTQ